ncbi:MAG: MqnA/MqnD/SBP family protein [Chloroflexota bacterium]|nr:MqnA/MqnD/SBP family protein [Chloroflexota bacterium]
MSKTIRIGHSPDADDAFMFYAIAHNKVDLGQYEFVHVVEDIESLNRRALDGELEATAISAAVYPRVAENYQILSCGASVGRSYGPIIVAKNQLSSSSLAGCRVAMPGPFTTAYLLMHIYCPEAEPVAMSFDAIVGAVNRGGVDAGLIIHEGQITYSDAGLHKVLDLGEVWDKDTGLPIPLGLDVVHRRLGEEDISKTYEVMYKSICYALEHEDEALDYALQYGRNVDKETCRRFVRMYVNQDTVQMGDEGRQALQKLYQLAADRDVISVVPPLDIVGLK